MFFLFVPDQLERGAEFGMQAIRAVTHHRQAAALQRAIFGEGGYDYMSARLDGAQHLAHIGRALLGCREEMKHRPVMPDIKGLCR